MVREEPKYKSEYSVDDVKKVNVSDYIENLDCIRQDEVLLKESFLYLLYYSQSTVRYDNAYPMYLLCYVYASKPSFISQTRIIVDISMDKKYLIYYYVLKVSKSQKHFFLKLYCPKNKQNI